VTTLDDDTSEATSCAQTFDRKRHDYAWWSTLLYGFEYFGWGEPRGYAAAGPCADTLSPVAAPKVGKLGEFASEGVRAPDDEDHLHVRETTRGQIVVDSRKHRGRYLLHGGDEDDDEVAIPTARDVPAAPPGAFWLLCGVLCATCIRARWRRAGRP